MTTAFEIQGGAEVSTPAFPEDDPIRVLIVDDEQPICSMLMRKLRNDFEVQTVTSGAEAIRRMDPSVVDVVVTDVMMPEVDGHSVLRHARMLAPPLPVIVMTGLRDVQCAVSAMKGGAFDYVTKPLDIPNLQAAIKVAHKQNSKRPSRSDESHLVGSPEWRDPFHRVLQRISKSSKNVLLVGETGTGKSLVAREIGRLSNRNGKFVEINCAAIPKTLMEARLFGTVKGAFTDAQDAPGLLEAAHGGTLFLDEIGELDIELQAKLLRVLQERKFSRVGATVEQQVDVRFIAATNVDLESAVADGKFRADLYYRLNVVQVLIPPLRARTNDIPLLIDRFREESEDPIPQLTPEAMLLLKRHQWPGNIRELRNVLERISVLVDPDQPITPKDVRKLITSNTEDLTTVSAAPEIVETSNSDDDDDGGDGGGNGGGFSTDLGEGQGLQEALDEYQRAIICDALERNKGNMSKTARELNIRRTTLIERCRKLGIKPNDYS